MDTTNNATTECRLAFLEGHAQGTTKRGDGFEARLKVLEAKIDAPIFVMEPAIEKRILALESAAREPQQAQEAKPRFEVQRTLEGWQIVDTHHLGVTVWSSDMATAFDADRHCARLNAAARSIENAETASPSLAATNAVAGATDWFIVAEDRKAEIQVLHQGCEDLKARAESAERERGEAKAAINKVASVPCVTLEESMRARDLAVREAVAKERERCLSGAFREFDSCNAEVKGATNEFSKHYFQGGADALARVCNRIENGAE